MRSTQRALHRSAAGVVTALSIGLASQIRIRGWSLLEYARLHAVWWLRRRRNEHIYRAPSTPQQAIPAAVAVSVYGPSMRGTW